MTVFYYIRESIGRKEKAQSKCFGLLNWLTNYFFNDWLRFPLYFSNHQPR
jgi:hypothetical protein